MLALAGSKIHFQQLSEADDTLKIKRILKLSSSCSSLNIPMIADAGNAGTVVRFLTAYFSQLNGKWLLTGGERMKNRPVGGLVEALRKLNADIVYAENEGFPPLLITGKKLQSKKINVDASQSSQFISALMLIAPYLKNGLHIHFGDQAVSFSYIEMTTRLMKKMGIDVQLNSAEVLVKHGKYSLKPIQIEADWSSAAYWYQIVAFGDNIEIFLPQLEKETLQGDKALAEIFVQLGVETVFEKTGIRLVKKSSLKTGILHFDFSSFPDIVPSVMVSCAALGKRAIFSNIEHLRYKESDRIASIDKELHKIGASVTKINTGYCLNPGNSPCDIPPLNSHNDHRIAMSLSPLALRYGKVEIENPDVVNKSYPAFWKELEKTGIFRFKSMEV